MSLLVQIQFCTNCHYHNSSTRHDQAKYAYYFQRLFQKIKIMADQQGLDINVMEKERPFDLIPASQTIHDNKCFNTENKRIEYFPKIGAFEVYVNHLLISSKIKSNKWPMVEAVAKKIIQMSKKHQNGQSILDYELGISELKKSNLVQKQFKVTGPPKYELTSLFRIRKQQKNNLNFYQNAGRLSKTIQLKKDAFYDPEIQTNQKNYRTFNRRSLNKAKDINEAQNNNFMRYDRDNQKIQQLPEIINKSRKDQFETKLLDYKPETPVTNRKKKIQRLSELKQIKKQDSVQRLLKIYDEHQLEFLTPNHKKDQHPQKEQNVFDIQIQQTQFKSNVQNRRRLKDPLEANNIKKNNQINAKFNQTDLQFYKAEKNKKQNDSTLKNCTHCKIEQNPKLQKKEKQKQKSKQVLAYKKQEKEKRNHGQQKILQQWFDNELKQANKMQEEELFANCLEDDNEFLIQDQYQQKSEQKKDQKKQPKKDQIIIEKPNQKKQKISIQPPKLDSYQPKPEDPAQYIKQKKRREALKSLKEQKKISEQCESVHYQQNSISQNSSYLQVQNTSNQYKQSAKRTKDDSQTQKNIVNIEQKNIKRPNTKQQKIQKNQEKIYEKPQNIIQEKQHNLQYSISITDSNFKQWDVKEFQIQKKKQGVFIEPTQYGNQQKKRYNKQKTQKITKTNQTVNMTDSLTIPRQQRKNIEVAHIINEEIMQGDIQEQQKDIQVQVKDQHRKDLQIVEQKKQTKHQNKVHMETKFIQNQKQQHKTKIENDFQNKALNQYQVQKQKIKENKIGFQQKQSKSIDIHQQNKQTHIIGRLQQKQQNKSEQKNINTQSQIIQQDLKSEKQSQMKEEQNKIHKNNERSQEKKIQFENQDVQSQKYKKQTKSQIINISNKSHQQSDNISKDVHDNTHKTIQITSTEKSNEKLVQWNAKYIQNQFNLIKQNQVVQTKKTEHLQQKKEVEAKLLQQKSNKDQKHNENGKTKVETDNNHIKWQASYDHQTQKYNLKGQNQKVKQKQEHSQIVVQKKPKLISKLEQFIQQQKQPKKQKNKIRWNAQYEEYRFNLIQNDDKVVKQRQNQNQELDQEKQAQKKQMQKQILENQSKHQIMVHHQNHQNSTQDKKQLNNNQVSIHQDIANHNNISYEKNNTQNKPILDSVAHHIQAQHQKDKIQNKNDHKITTLGWGQKQQASKIIQQKSKLKVQYKNQKHMLNLQQPTSTQKQIKNIINIDDHQQHHSNLNQQKKSQILNPERTEKKQQNQDKKVESHNTSHLVNPTHIKEQNKEKIIL